MRKRTIAQLCAALVVACSAQSGKRAAQGAVGGALSGAVGGLVSSLVFGGDAGERMARGAVWGGTTGAVGGAVVGAQEDARRRKAQERELKRLRGELGDDAFEGLADLADGRHEEALVHARKAAGAENKRHALAGLWMEALVHADARELDRARTLFPEIVRWDPDVQTVEQAEVVLYRSFAELEEIRKRYGQRS
jgi:hypothetical protein